MPKRAVKPLYENDIKTVSELLNTEEEKLIEIKGITETSLEKIYNAIQSFVEKNQISTEVIDEDDKEELNESIPVEDKTELEKAE